MTEGAKRDSWLVRHTWKYVVYDPTDQSRPIHYVSGTKRDAFAYADVYTSLMDNELCVRRESTWWKPGKVLNVWWFGGFFDDSDSFGAVYE